MVSAARVAPSIFSPVGTVGNEVEDEVRWYVFRTGKWRSPPIVSRPARFEIFASAPVTAPIFKVLPATNPVLKREMSKDNMIIIQIFLNILQSPSLDIVFLYAA